MASTQSEEERQGKERKKERKKRKEKKSNFKPNYAEPQHTRHQERKRTPR
jgi:hypothetical protein